MESRKDKYQISQEEVDQDEEPRKTPRRRDIASLTPSSDSEEGDNMDEMAEEEKKRNFSVRKARPSIRILQELDNYDALDAGEFNLSGFKEKIKGKVKDLVYADRSARAMLGNTKKGKKRGPEILA
jgi:hypothetical protein